MFLYPAHFIYAQAYSNIYALACGTELKSFFRMLYNSMQYLPKVIALSISQIMPSFFAFVCLIGMQVVWLQDKVAALMASYMHNSQQNGEPRRLETGLILEQFALNPRFRKCHVTSWTFEDILPIKRSWCHVNVILKKWLFRSVSLLRLSKCRLLVNDMNSVYSAISPRRSIMYHDIC